VRPGKAIRRVADVLPDALAPFVRSHGRCVAATNVGIRVLARLGVAAGPLTVDVQAFNAAMVQWVLDGEPGGRPEFERRGCYFLTSKATPGAPVRAPTRPVVGTQWHGHLVVVVPAQRVIVDLDARALARPEFDLHVPPALVVPWDGTCAELRCDNGARLLYTARLDPLTGRPDRAFEEAPDWRTPLDDVAQRIERLARH
jgi:hypothetical protein